MKLHKLLFSLILVLLVCSVTWAQDLAKGYHGMKWGSSIHLHKNLVLIHSNAPAAYYSNAAVAYQLSGTQVSSVIYGFYHDQLFAAFIQLKTPLQFTNLKRHFSTRHGEPKTTRHSTSGLTVYRWKDKDIKIKLKMKELTNDRKMAIYYAPLAVQLNQEQLENIPKDFWNLHPSNKGKALKKEPLIIF